MQRVPAALPETPDFTSVTLFPSLLSLNTPGCCCTSLLSRVFPLPSVTRLARASGMSVVLPSWPMDTAQTSEPPRSWAHSTNAATASALEDGAGRVGRATRAEDAGVGAGATAPAPALDPDPDPDPAPAPAPTPALAGGRDVPPPPDFTSVTLFPSLLSLNTPGCCCTSLLSRVFPLPSVTRLARASGMSVVLPSWPMDTAQTSEPPRSWAHSTNAATASATVPPAGLCIAV